MFTQIEVQSFIRTWMCELTVDEVKQQTAAACMWVKAVFTNLPVDQSSDPGVHFHAGLSDCKAIIGEPAELECKVSSEECEGIWYKDGDEVSLSMQPNRNFLFWCIQMSYRFK